jgi:hypothetical protein
LKAAVLAVVAALALVAPASASVTPVGPLPDGPVTTIRTQRGSLVAVALPRPRPATGLVWRLARDVDPRVARQVSEADVGRSVVVVFKVVGRGNASIVFALTRGESSPDVLRALWYRVRVS